MTPVPKAEEHELPAKKPFVASGEKTPRSTATAGFDESQLVLRAQKGDSEAFEILVRAHQQRVFAVVGGILRVRADVEDVAQQVFMKAYFSLPRFDQRAAFSTWLYKIAVNECWDYLRKKKVRRLVYESDLSEEQVRQFTSSSEHSATAERYDPTSRRVELRQLVERLLSELDERDRLMLLLKEVEGFSVEEISGILGLNVNTVKVRLFRARARLTAIYRKKWQGAIRRSKFVGSRTIKARS
jgi:RNA polymerase sigma-70 factor (ECF subfamily)